MSPEYIRGWNAAISHAEDYLVSLGYRAGSTEGVSKDYTSMSSFAQRVIMSTAEMLGRCHKPTIPPFSPTERTR